MTTKIDEIVRRAIQEIWHVDYGLCSRNEAADHIRTAIEQAVAAKDAEIARLREALEVTSVSIMDDGSPCWCYDGFTGTHCVHCQNMRNAITQEPDHG